MMPFQANIYQLADELRAVASLGLRYTKDLEVQDRYNRVLTYSTQLVAMLEQRPPEDVLKQYEGVHERLGPLLASSAALFRDDGLLLVRRPDTGLWSLPRDFVGMDETLAEGATRGLLDQAGMAGEATGLLGVFDSQTWGYPAKSQFYQIVFHVESSSDRLWDPEEGDVRLVSQEELSALSPGVDPVVTKVFDRKRGQDAPFFDLGDRQSIPAVGQDLEVVLARTKAHVDELLAISVELSEIGTNGVAFPEHQYAVERYQHMLSVSTRLAQAVKEWSADEASVRYEDNLGLQGLRVGAFAAAFRDGEILLIRREDTGLWAMPGGSVDVGETWAVAAGRELEEETAVGGEVVDLLALFDYRLLRPPPRPLVMAAFLVEPDPDAEPQAMPETLGAGYFPVSKLPEMSPGSAVPMVIDLYEGRVPRPHVDLARG